MTKEQKNELKEIRKAMDEMNDEYVFAHWDRFLELHELENEEYRKENQASFDKFYKENIEGKAWEDIDPENWQRYSDWYKDMYGFRPQYY